MHPFDIGPRGKSGKYFLTSEVAGEGLLRPFFLKS